MGITLWGSVAIVAVLTGAVVTTIAILNKERKE